MLQIRYCPSARKTKIILYRKNAPKGDISRITEQDDIPPRKDGTYVEIPY